MIDLKAAQFKTLANPIYIGSHKIDAIYKGSVRIYPTGLLGGWVPITFGGLDEHFQTGYLWKDSNKVYYSYGYDHYAFNSSTQSWEPITWYRYKQNIWGQETSELIEIYMIGYQIWTNGTNIYWSNGYNVHYVLDRETSIWRKKTWTNVPNDFISSAVWTDGTYTYYKLSHVLNGSTWVEKDWGDIPSDLNQDFSVGNIWTDGTNVYFSGWIDSTGFSYVLNKQTSRWEPKTFYFKYLDGHIKEWNPYTGGAFIFDGLDGNMYYAHVFGRGYDENDSCVLKKGTSTWTPIKFDPIPLRDSDKVYYLFANDVWSDGKHVYYEPSGDTEYDHYVLI